jgi:acetoin utilization protein AcuB
MSAVTAVFIRDRMSPLTHSIGDDQTMAEAAKRMREHGIRHLPVLRGGRIVGILSERDIALVESLPGVDPEVVTVAEAMTEEPYTVAPDAKLADVVAEMARQKYGAALIAEGSQAVGIFTTVDALQLAHELLDRS